MKCALLDRDLDRVALADTSVRAEPPDQRRPLGRTGRKLLESAVVADVLGELPHLLGDCLTRGDGEVNEHLRAERLAELDLSA